MTAEDVKTQVYAYLRDEVIGSEQFDTDTNIVQDGLVDSMSILTLVQFLETAFGVTIEFEAITPENFHNVDAIARFVATLSS